MFSYVRTCASFHDSVQDISVSVSVLTLTFIAYDRYYAICRPLQFSSRKTKAAIVIAAIWYARARAQMRASTIWEKFEQTRTLAGRTRELGQLVHTLAG